MTTSSLRYPCNGHYQLGSLNWKNSSGLILDSFRDPVSRCLQVQPVVAHLPVPSSAVPWQPNLLGDQQTTNLPIWDYNYIQSLSSDYAGETYKRQLEKLKEQVKMMLDKLVEPLDQLELIDKLQRLGVSYHFEDEIKKILKSIYNNFKSHDSWKNEDLYATALQFRLLRQHGYDVSQEVFECFKDEYKGNFKASLCEDTKGMLYLYEASYMLINGENNLELAREFTTKHLKDNLEQNMDQNLAILIQHALELPLHWRMLRLEARWFIDVYERKPDMNPVLLEFAILDFNIVQITHQSDLKYIASWWKSTCLAEKLTFARDRLMECFLWTVGEIYEPQYGYCRRMSTKLVALITIIDDVYDVYGTWDELELFTDAVERWDINAMDQLPDYMKICFLALYNSINEMAYDALKQGSHIISYLKKTDELKRGDVPKSIQCYMHETGVSEKDAREHIRFLISETWKKMNEDRVAKSPFSETFIGIAMNIARMAQCMYQYGDGHGIQDRGTKERVLSLLIKPIRLV
ncbi:hypothetical protein F0562_028878 [Nyssa sinensis]|uniref:Uncharacterized protein n=1 Tax=Nyssa sinensis TaxID=561372 RepID=A0A5J5B1I1_9ASTE|nr:hypothetical protein F0562_028878 [Nyssa sinensis]